MTLIFIVPIFFMKLVINIFTTRIYTAVHMIAFKVAQINWFVFITACFCTTNCDCYKSIWLRIHCVCVEPICVSVIRLPNVDVTGNHIRNAINVDGCCLQAMRSYLIGLEIFDNHVNAFWVCVSFDDHKMKGVTSNMHNKIDGNFPLNSAIFRIRYVSIKTPTDKANLTDVFRYKIGIFIVEFPSVTLYLAHNLQHSSYI